MKKKNNIIIWIATISIVIGMAYLVYYSNIPTNVALSPESEVASNKSINESDTEKSAKLSFYEIENNCTLDGEIFIEENYLGDVKNGIFILNKSKYLEEFYENVKLSIIGETNACFGKNSNLPFKAIWDVPNLNYYFQYNDSVLFGAKFNPRRPTYYEEMRGFVRPEEVRNHLERNIAKYFKTNSTEDNLDKISEYATRYRSDSLLFNQEEYWQTPAETLEKGHGDCEDWAVTTLSIMRAYNESLKCYNSLWETHLSIMCFMEDSMIIYDQGNIKFKTSLNFNNLNEQEKKSKIRKTRNDYFDEYGIKPNERMLYALFNENELITFDTEEDFINWVVYAK